MSFHGFLCDSMPTPLVGFRRFLLYDYLSVVSRRFYASVMYKMSQSPHSYFRIDTLSRSASTTLSPRPTSIKLGTILLPIGVTSPSISLETRVPSSITPRTVVSSISTPLRNGLTSFKPLPTPPTSSTDPSDGFASSFAPGGSSPLGSNSSAPVIGTYSTTPIEPTEAFLSYKVPTRVTIGAAVTSEAAQLTGLIFAIYANRNRITDVNLKQKYIDDFKRTKEETDFLFNAFDIKLDPIPKCSNTKKKRYAISEKKLRLFIAKRDFISGITGLLGDAVKLLSCATQVVNNLVRAVEAPVPTISDIESLTNALNKIAQDLEKEDQNLCNSPSDSQPSSTQKSTASSSALSYTASSANPRCTESVILFTSFLEKFDGAKNYYASLYHHNRMWRIGQHGLNSHVHYWGCLCDKLCSMR